MSRDGNTKRQSLSFDNFDNLRDFKIKHQKLISETKTVPKILKKPKKTKDQNKLQKKKTEIGKNSFWFKITPITTSLWILILQIFPCSFVVFSQVKICVWMTAPQWVVRLEKKCNEDEC